MRQTFPIHPILVIAPEGENRERVVTTVRKCGFDPVDCSNLGLARNLLTQQHFSAVFCTEALPDGDFRAVVAAVKPVPVVVLSRHSEWDPYLAALRAGAFDYITCPLDSGETQRALWSAISESSAHHKYAQAAA